MKSWRIIVIGTGALAFAGMVLVHQGNLEARRLRDKVEALEQEKSQLADYAQRLSASRRVAQVNVLEQRTDEAGSLKTRLLWQELAADGVISRPVNLEVVGRLVYFEAFVLKFSHQHVGQGDPGRGGSLAMFRRVFGDLQSPESVPQFDRAAPPALDLSPEGRLLEERLWSRFWDFAEDPRLAAEYGVRVAQCEAPAVRLKAGQVWELTLDAAGGLNLKKLVERQMVTHSESPGS